MAALSDSSHASDKEKRTSITGFIVYFLNVPVAWRSRGQKGVAISSTEAEYVLLREVFMEVKFILYILDSMGVKVELPIEVGVDNIGAIWLARNKTSSDRTKHVDIRAHFTRSVVEEGLVVIVFRRSEENESDIFTKNVTGDLNAKFSSKLICDKAEVCDVQKATGRVLEDVDDLAVDSVPNESHICCYSGTRAEVTWRKDPQVERHWLNGLESKLNNAEYVREADGEVGD